MVVPVEYRILGSADETRQLNLAGAESAQAPHRFDKIGSAVEHQNIYSRSLTAALSSPVPTAGLLFDLSALTYPGDSTPIDMVTNQRLALLLFSNIGSEPATVTLENATVPIANGTFKLPAGSVMALQSTTNLLLSEQILNIRLVCDTAASQTDMEMLIASLSTI